MFTKSISNHPSGPYPLVFLTAVEASGWGEVINDDHSPFKTISWNNQIHLLDMVEDELKEVIEKPAQKYGVKLANGLCNRILRDVNNEPKSLPLLECAMSELWKKREGKAISHTAYQDHKGIKGAVDRYAEKTLGELAANDSSIQNKILHIFLLLVLVYEIDGINEVVSCNCPT